MTRSVPRTNFHGSELIRCLADLDMADAAEAGDAFAEKLGTWIHFADAITLSAVHSEGIPAAPARPAAFATAQPGLAEFDRIRTFLVTSITRSCSPTPGRTHIQLPAPLLELPMNLVAAYTPYRRFYEAHQRDMESSIQPLRANLREALAKATPRLRKLAQLDVTMEKILRERESRLLAKVPLLLRPRFERLYKEHQQGLAEAGQADNPAAWTQAGAWLARFCLDMQTLLLAEVELRLQPALGLIEASKQDTQ